jgi:hypothetical protein
LLAAKGQNDLVLLVLVTLMNDQVLITLVATTSDVLNHVALTTSDVLNHVITTSDVLNPVALTTSDDLNHVALTTSDVLDLNLDLVPLTTSDDLNPVVRIIIIKNDHIQDFMTIVLTVLRIDLVLEADRQHEVRIPLSTNFRN